MKNILYSICIVGLTQMPLAALTEEQQALKKRVDNAKGVELLQIIDGVKVKAFSKDSLIKDGLKAEDLKGWEDIFNTTHAFINEKTKNYSSDLKTLSEAYDRLKFLVSALNAMYGDSKRLQESKSELKTMIKEINTIISGLLKINDAMLTKITQSTPVPTSWSQRLYLDSGKVKHLYDMFASPKELSEFEEFLNVYEKTGKDTFDQFMIQVGIHDAKSAEKKIDMLEDIEFILVKRNAKTKRPERTRHIKLIQEIIAELRKRFPDYITSLQFNKLTEATDKVGIILFAQSGALQSVFKQLQREVTQLSK